MPYGFEVVILLTDIALNLGFSHWIVKQILQWLRFSQDFKPRYTSTKQLPVGGWDSYSPYLSLTQKPKMQRRAVLILPFVYFTQQQQAPSCTFCTPAVGTQFLHLCNSETPYRDVMGMLREKRGNGRKQHVAWKAELMAIGTNGETNRWKQTNWRTWTKTENMTDWDVCCSVDKQSSNKHHNKILHELGSALLLLRL